jgi:hypothetical protein
VSRRLALGSSLFLLILGLPPAWGAESPRDAAERFGSALATERLEDLRPLLPQRGKVRLKLVRLGPEDGEFGADQVEAILADFLASGAVSTFEVARAEEGGSGDGLVNGRATVVDRGGRSCRVRLHLAFEMEAGRWILREIKETGE